MAGTIHGSYEFPFGSISYEASSHGLQRIRLGERADSQPSPWHMTLQAWFAAYLRGQHRPLQSLQLNFQSATLFQRQVWDILCTIPFGETRTYQWVADQLKNPKAVRTVGQACGANRFPILIPCHRVISSTGLGGFSGPAGWKEKLLTFEAHTLPSKIDTRALFSDKANADSCPHHRIISRP